MGNRVSELPPVPPNFPYFSLMFQRNDKIRIINGNQTTIGTVREMLMTLWPLGIQHEQNESNVYVIKLVGNPFREHSNRDEAINIRRFCCGLIAMLRARGWELIVCTDLSRQEDLTTWFFQQNPALTAIPHSPMVCALSVSGFDRFQLVNAPQQLQPALLQPISYFGFLQEQIPITATEMEVKLRGYPWTSSDFREIVNMRRCLLGIIRSFDADKFKFTANANLKGTTDTLFFQQDDSIIPGQTRFCLISLNKTDRLRLIEAPPEMVAVVRDCIARYYPRGLQNEANFADMACYEFKLAGTPWFSYMDESTTARLLITLILQTLVANGWAVHCALDVTRKANDKGVLVLRSCAPMSMPHFCLCPSNSDIVKIVNAPPDIQQLVAGVIRTHWLHGVARESPVNMAYEMKLNGNPWGRRPGHVVHGQMHHHQHGIGAHRHHARPAPMQIAGLSGNEYALIRHVLAVLLSELNARGWRVIASMDVSSRLASQATTGTGVGVHGNDGDFFPDDVHSWFIAYTGVATMQAAATAPASLPAEVTANEAPPPSYPEVAS